MPNSNDTTLRPAPWTPPAPIPCFRQSGDLLIRTYEPSDAEQLFRAIDSSRATLFPWLPWAMSQHLSLDASRESIARFDASRDNLLAPEFADVGVVYGVFDVQSGELVGGTGFNRFHPASHNAETGYWVRADKRRQGICSRTLAATLSLAFTPQPVGFGFRRVHLFAGIGNIASQGVPRKLGLRQHMHATRDRWVETFGWHDSLGWEVLAEEWDCAANKRNSGESR